MELDNTQLSLRDTLLSGQCFRVRYDEGTDVWTVRAGCEGDFHILKVSQKDLSPITDNPFCANYFDVQTDYQTMKDSFSKVSPLMRKACEYAPGIRILNQDPWEALCSFVVSQNNNIKRIMGIISRMCAFYSKGGHDCDPADDGSPFPTARTLANASEDDLRHIGLGFRASYVINTAKAVDDGLIILDDIRKMDIDSARSTLMSVKGIGPKVADCALLFGCHRLDCFPMDVWMKRIMATFFPGHDKSIFGNNAGVAQQYLFHYGRTSGCFDDLGKED